MVAPAQPSPVPQPSVNKLRAYLELCRAPNCFTAMADPLAGALVAGAALPHTHRIIAVMLAGAFLYAGGIALNDWHDYKRDLTEHPQRPIPSKRVYRFEALILAMILLAFGLSCAAIAGSTPMRVGLLLFVCILLYDVLLKEVPIAPAIMGMCRAMNLLMGLTVVSLDSSPATVSLRWFLAALMAVYVTGITVFARGESGQDDPRRLTLTAVAAIAPICLLALSRILFPDLVPYWHGKIHAGALLVVVGFAMTRAVLTPQPAQIQQAIKLAVLGIIVFDAAMVAYMRPFVASLAVLLLLIPAIWLGRWIYST